MEGPLRSFIKRVVGLKDLPYCERLARMKLLSVQRRAERYKILYMKKLLFGSVPDLGVEVATGCDTRLGRQLAIKPRRGSRSVMTLRERSFLVEGPKLFNALPKFLRNHEGSVESFKHALDKFLEEIPDQPRMTGFEPFGTDTNGAPSNSLTDILRGWGHYGPP